MRWRTFFDVAANLFRPEPVARSADGLSEIYSDSVILIKRLYHKRPRLISRAVMQGRGMSNGRWSKARGLLLQVRVIDEQNAVRDDIAPDAQTADELISTWIDAQREIGRASCRARV